MAKESIESVTAEFDRSLKKIEEKQQQLTELSKQLQAHRSTAASEDGTVRATVDGSGRLRELHIGDEAISEAHPERLGRKVTQAVRRARGEATSANSADVAAALPFIPSNDESQGTPESPSQFGDERIEVPIEGGFGIAVADGFGRFRGVKIDPRSVAYTTASKLGPRILHAIQQAEEKARALCVRNIREQ